MDHFLVRILPVEFLEPPTWTESVRNWSNRYANFESPEVQKGPICD